MDDNEEQPQIHSDDRAVRQAKVVSLIGHIWDREYPLRYVVVSDPPSTPAYNIDLDIGANFAGQSPMLGFDFGFGRDDAGDVSVAESSTTSMPQNSHRRQKSDTTSKSSGSGKGSSLTGIGLAFSSTPPPGNWEPAVTVRSTLPTSSLISNPTEPVEKVLNLKSDVETIQRKASSGTPTITPSRPRHPRVDLLLPGQGWLNDSDSDSSSNRSGSSKITSIHQPTFADPTSSTISFPTAYNIVKGVPQHTPSVVTPTKPLPAPSVAVKEPRDNYSVWPQIKPPPAPLLPPPPPPPPPPPRPPAIHGIRKPSQYSDTLQNTFYVPPKLADVEAEDVKNGPKTVKKAQSSFSLRGPLHKMMRRSSKPQLGDDYQRQVPTATSSTTSIVAAEADRSTPATGPHRLLRKSSKADMNEDDEQMSSMAAASSTTSLANTEPNSPGPMAKFRGLLKRGSKTSINEAYQKSTLASASMASIAESEAESMPPVPTPIDISDHWNALTREEEDREERIKRIKREVRNQTRPELRPPVVAKRDQWTDDSHLESLLEGRFQRLPDGRLQRLLEVRESLIATSELNQSDNHRANTLDKWRAAMGKVDMTSARHPTRLPKIAHPESICLESPEVEEPLNVVVAATERIHVPRPRPLPGRRMVTEPVHISHERSPYLALDALNESNQSAAEKVRRFSRSVREAASEEYDRRAELYRTHSDEIEARPISVISAYDGGIRQSQYGYLGPLLGAARARESVITVRRRSMSETMTISSGNTMSTSGPLMPMTAEYLEDPFSPTGTVQLERENSPDSSRPASVATIRPSRPIEHDSPGTIQRTYFDDDDEIDRSARHAHVVDLEEDEGDEDDDSGLNDQSGMEDMIAAIDKQTSAWETAGNEVGVDKHEGSDVASLSGISPSFYKDPMSPSPVLARASPTPMGVAEHRRQVFGGVPLLNLFSTDVPRLRRAAHKPSPLRATKSYADIHREGSPSGLQKLSSADFSSFEKDSFLVPGSSHRSSSRPGSSSSSRAPGYDIQRSIDDATKEHLIERLGIVHPAFRKDISKGMEGSLGDLFVPVVNGRRDDGVGKAFGMMSRDLQMLLKLYRRWVVKEQGVLLHSDVLANMLVEEAWSCYREWFGIHAMKQVTEAEQRHALITLNEELHQMVDDEDIPIGKLVKCVLALYTKECHGVDKADCPRPPTMLQSVLALAGATARVTAAALEGPHGSYVRDTKQLEQDLEKERMTRWARVQHDLASTGLVLRNDKPEAFSPLKPDSPVRLERKLCRKSASEFRKLARTAMYESRMAEHASHAERDLPEWLTTPIKHQKVLQALAKSEGKRSRGRVLSEQEASPVHWTPTQKYLGMADGHKYRALDRRIAQTLAI